MLLLFSFFWSFARRGFEREMRERTEVALRAIESRPLSLDPDPSFFFLPSPSFFLHFSFSFSPLLTTTQRASPSPFPEPLQRR